MRTRLRQFLKRCRRGFPSGGTLTVDDAAPCRVRDEVEGTRNLDDAVWDCQTAEIIRRESREKLEVLFN
jgi:hypothetical protein